MRSFGLSGGLCVATVVVAAVWSIDSGEWGVWIPVLAALACVAGLRRAMSQRRPSES
jgi:hypothetical protein